MREWAKAKIGEVSLGIYDGPHATPAPCETPGPYFLGIPQISPLGFIDMSSPRYIAERDYGAWTKRVVPQYGDVIFSYEATLNLYALIPRDFKCCLGRRMGLVRPNPKKLDFQFLYYYFFSPEWRGTVRENTITGATVDRLSIAAFPNFEIALPPLPMQRRIATILSDYDSAIDNARRQIALLEEAAMRLYREWFVVHTDQKWEKRRLWDVCDYFRGVSYTSKEIEGKDGVPLITLKNIERFGGFREDRSKTFSGVCKDGSSARPNDVLMAVTDMTKERRLVGHVAMVPDTYDKAQFSMDLIRLKGKLVSNSFLYAMLRYSTYADEFAVRASGANVLHLKPSSLDDCEVVVPKRELREKFDFAFVPMVQKKNALYRTILRLTEARDRLLPKLMSGEIEV